MDPREMLIALYFTRPVADILIGIMTIRQNGRCILIYYYNINWGVSIRKISNGGVRGECYDAFLPNASWLKWWVILSQIRLF
jgi:hypothetical protein